MDKQQKQEFISDFLNGMRDSAISKIDRMPDNWDGHEIRFYLAGKFGFEVSDLMRNKRSRRVKQFYNTILVNNL